MEDINAIKKVDIERIQNEMKYLLKSENIPVNKVERIENNDLHWKVVFDGPEETAYEDGIFTLEFIFPNNYPEKGPEARFITKMFHPNVNSDVDNHVCINLLNKWDKKRTIEDVMLGIFDILINPTVINAYPNEATTLLGEDIDKYYDTVEEYTYKYATHEL